MAIRLMADIPYDAVFRCIKNIMEGYSEFYYSETRGEMPRIYRQFIDNILSQFVAKLWQLVYRKPTQVVGIFYLAE